MRYGLPIDPIPLPEPDAPAATNDRRTLRPLSLLLTFALVVGTVLRSRST